MNNVLTDGPAIVLVALLIEAGFGYPQAVYAAIGHPVTWMGRLIARLDRSRRRGRVWGGLALAVILFAAAVPSGLLGAAAAGLPPLGRLLLLALAGSTLLAQRSLAQHVAAVSDGLHRGLPEGRHAVSQIVGRDPDQLDGHGVARAAIESLAENFADGVTAPAFWGCVLGLPGMALYKAANTADSMIGHHTPRHETFGWAAARFDDLVNLPASRLAALFLVLAAAMTRGADAGAAWRSVWRDAGRHRSPNAGYPEAAMAGALGLRLAGPRRYAGVLVPDGWMGDGRAEATAGDIDAALRLYRRACAVQIGVVGGLALSAMA